MKGLIAQNINHEEQAEAPEQEQQAAPEATDEDVERVVLGAKSVLFEDATHDGIVKMLQSGAADPANALARVTTHVITQLDEAAGGKIPDDAILPAAVEILPEVAELAQKSGAFQADDEVMGQAFGKMLQMFEDHGWITDEDKAEMQQILAEQEGANGQIAE